jgi:hypothetical protein
VSHPLPEIISKIVLVDRRPMCPPIAPPLPLVHNFHPITRVVKIPSNSNRRYSHSVCVRPMTRTGTVPAWCTPRISFNSLFSTWWHFVGKYLTPCTPHIPKVRHTVGSPLSREREKYMYNTQFILSILGPYSHLIQIYLALFLIL